MSQEKKGQEHPEVREHPEQKRQEESGREDPTEASEVGRPHSEAEKLNRPERAA